MSAQVAIDVIEIGTKNAPTVGVRIRTTRARAVRRCGGGSDYVVLACRVHTHEHTHTARQFSPSDRGAGARRSDENGEEATAGWTGYRRSKWVPTASTTAGFMVNLS